MVARARNRRWHELEKDNIPLEKLARHFEAYNRTEGKSPRTVECYSRVLRYFGDYLKEHDYTDILGHLDIAVVRDFILYLQNTTRWKNHPFTMPNGSLSPTSVQNYVRTLRPFFSWLQRELKENRAIKGNIA